MATIMWRIFALGLAAYVISILVSPYDFSDIGSLLLHRILPSIVWIAASVGLIFYAFGIHRGPRKFWIATKFAWLGLGCVLLNYGWQTTTREIVDGNLILAIISLLLIIFANYVALHRLSNEK